MGKIGRPKIYRNIMTITINCEKETKEYIEYLVKLGVVKTFGDFLATAVEQHRKNSKNIVSEKQKQFLEKYTKVRQ